MQILFCTDGIFPSAIGGIQRHSRLLIEALARREEHEIIVIHPHPGELFFSAYPNVKEISISPRPGKRQYLIECYEYSKQVARITHEYPSAVIYSQGLSVWHDINELRRRLVVNPHGLEPYQALGLKNKVYSIPFRIVLRYILGRAKYVVALGGHLTTLLRRRFGDRKIVVIPNAVNLPADTPIKRFSSPYRLLFVGRFAFNKGIDVLLKAAKELNSNGLGEDLEYHLVGSGPLFDKLSTKYQHSNIVFEGKVDDAKLFQLYADADLLVFPTLFEGMPTVVLEAMSRKTPIIVTDVGATRELVDSENGYIIEKRSVASIKNAIKEFVRLPRATKEEMGAESRRRVEQRFTWDAVAEKHSQLFDQVAKNSTN